MSSQSTVEGSDAMFPMVSFLIIHNPLLLDFEAMGGSQGSAFPWDANTFTLSFSFFPQFFPRLAEQDKYSPD